MSEKDYQNARSLKDAIKDNNVSLTKDLISQGADVNFIDYPSYSALYIASQLGNLDIVKLLVQNGADINVGHNTGRDYDHAQYPLTIAIENYHFEIATYLISKGANVNSNEGWGYSPIRVLSQVYHSRYKFPVYQKDKLESLYQQEENLLKLLIDNKADIHSKDVEGDTPLHRAISISNLHIAKLLIGFGIDINARGRHGETPIFNVHNLDDCQFCIDNGADLNIHDTYTASTPLHIAAAFRNPKAIKLLINNGAFVNSTQEDGRTPLHQAIYFGCKLDNVQTLLDMGADADAFTGVPNETALDMALGNWESGDNRAAVLLLKEHTTIKPKYPPKSWD